MYAYWFRSTVSSHVYADYCTMVTRATCNCIVTYRFIILSDNYCLSFPTAMVTRMQAGDPVAAVRISEAKGNYERYWSDKTVPLEKRH